MKKMCIVMLVLLLVLTLFSGMALAATPVLLTEGDLTWSDNGDGTVTITGYTGTATNIIIPDTLDGKSVTVIGDYAFWNNRLTSVVIPSSVTTIGNYAFSYNQLTSVVIPSSVTTIGRGAFAENKLTSVTIPDSVTTIGNEAFYRNQLTSVTIPSSVTTIGANAFQNNQLTSVVIPSSVTTIGGYAFAENKLTSVVIPSSVTTIGWGAFAYNQLTSVTIPDSVTTIGERAFAANELKIVAISKNVTSIENYTFEGNQLTSVTIPEGVTKIGDFAFAHNSLEILTIPNSVTSIGARAFSGNQLTSVTIPDSVTSIGAWAFYNNQLTSVTIPDSVTEIGDKAFDGNLLAFVVIENDGIQFSGDSIFGDGTTIISSDSSTAKAYAVNHGLPFLDIDTIRFQPNGGWANQIHVEVNAPNQSSAHYLWSTSKAMPDLDLTNNHDWEAFAGSHPAPPPSTTSVWYLHVRAEVADSNHPSNGLIWVRRSKPFSLDPTAPSIVLKNAPVDWANRDVEVTVEVDDAHSGVLEVKYAFGQQDLDYFANNGIALDVSNLPAQITVTENGWLTVYAKDRAGNEAIEQIELKNIDRVKPVIELKAPTDPTNRDVEVTVAVDDAELGLAEVKYAFGRHDAAYFTNNGTALDVSNLPAQITVTDNGWLTVYAKDQAGNETIEQIEIKNIDRVKPVITLIGDTVMRVTRGSDFTDPGYTATDDVDGDITAQVVVSGDVVDTGKTGEYTILYDVTDAAGNAADQVKRRVHVYVPSSYSGGGGGAQLPTQPKQTVVYVGEEKTIQWQDELILSIPAGATEQTIIITISQAEDTDALLASLDEGHTIISAIYEIVKDKSGDFQKPVTLSIRFDPVKVGEHQTVSIFYYDEEEQKWVDLGGSADGEWITTEINHFAKFAVLAVDAEIEMPSEPTPALLDIAGHWGEVYILEAVEKKLVQGYPDGTFRPDQPITRAEFLVMLVKALGLKGGEAALPFTDRDKIGPWAREAVAIAVQEGIVTGYADGTFRPDAYITRAEMAVMIARALGMAVGAEIRTAFADDQEIPAWAKGAVEALRQQGIIQGREGNRFSPRDTATRAEAAVMLLRMMEYGD